MNCPAFLSEKQDETDKTCSLIVMHLQAIACCLRVLKFPNPEYQLWIFLWFAEIAHAETSEINWPAILSEKQNETDKPTCSLAVMQLQAIAGCFGEF